MLLFAKSAVVSIVVVTSGADGGLQRQADGILLGVETTDVMKNEMRTYDWVIVSLISYTKLS